LPNPPASHAVDLPGAESPFSPGSVIDGKYRIDRRLAEGGIGIILAATHQALGRRVAIKHLKAQALGDARIVDRFEREGRLAVQIASEHVVRVLDVGRHPRAGPYLVMEYLEGEDLGRALERGPLPLPRAVAYVLQACEALADAHALGIVHRDIKPDNLFLATRQADQPIVKILDFGISKLAPKRGTDGSWAHQTQASERFGTPVYMSPEQLRASAQVDARADIWAMGVTLFELLTGEAPFTGDDVPQLCTSILTTAPRPLRELRPGAPEGLEKVLLRCLEKDPAKRYRNVAELAQELAPFAAPESVRHVGRISAVLQKAGHSIRPPTPQPGTLQIADLAPFALMAPTSGAPSDPQERQGTDPRLAATLSLSDARRTRTRWIAVAGAAVVAGIAAAWIGAVSLSRSDGARSAAAGSPSAVVAPSAPLASASPGPSAPGGDPWVAVSPPPPASAAASSAPAIATAHGSSTKPGGGGARVTSAGAHGGSAAPATTPDPRAGFGERE